MCAGCNSSLLWPLYGAFWKSGRNPSYLADYLHIRLLSQEKKPVQ